MRLFRNLLISGWIVYGVVVLSLVALRPSPIPYLSGALQLLNLGLVISSGVYIVLRFVLRSAGKGGAGSSTV
jgi:hypothetical protein